MTRMMFGVPSLSLVRRLSACWRRPGWARRSLPVCSTCAGRYPSEHRRLKLVLIELFAIDFGHLAPGVVRLCGGFGHRLIIELDRSEIGVWRIGGRVEVLGDPDKIDEKVVDSAHKLRVFGPIAELQAAPRLVGEVRRRHPEPLRAKPDVVRDTTDGVFIGLADIAEQRQLRVRDRDLVLDLAVSDAYGT